MVESFIILFGVVALVVVVLLYIYYKSGLQDDDYSDYTLLENYMSQYTNGFSEGTLIGISKGETRTGYLFMPKDVDYLRRMKRDGKVEIEPQLIFAENWQRILLPKSSLSGERNKIKILPYSPEDVPQEIRDTPFGKTLMEMIKNRRAERNVISVMRKEKELEDEMLIRTKGKDRIREYLALDKALTKDFAKKMLDAKDDKKAPPSFGQPHGGIGGQ